MVRTDKMKKMKIGLVIILALTIMTAGCLGGGEDDGGEPPEMVEAKGTTGTEGVVETLAQAQPEPASETVELTIHEGNLTSIDFTIKVEDGDDGTNADEVSGSLDSPGGFNETLAQGQTPYTKIINIKAGEDQTLPNQWTISLDVVCHASDDTWPGPIMWFGTPDNGFSYNVSVTYKYLKAAETG
jgi:hypothetical protein